MDLYHKNQKETIDEEWRTGIPDKNRCKVKVQLSNGDEIFAYFYADKGQLFGMLGGSTHFWNSETHKPIYNVTHYKMLKDAK